MGTIYALWMANRKSAFYALTPAQLEEYYQNRSRVFKEAGGKEYFFCASGWANERWMAWGLEEFPSVEAKVAYSTGLDEIGHIRYSSARTMLGVLMPGTQFTLANMPVYRAYWMNPTEPWYALSPEQQGDWLRKVEQTYAEFGGKGIILCSSHWATSEWLYWGVEAYPSLDAMIGRTRKLQEMGWFKFTQAGSLPGISMG